MNMIDINDAGFCNGYAHARCEIAQASTSEKSQTPIKNPYWQKW